jgi:hypothetical protein
MLNNLVAEDRIQRCPKHMLNNRKAPCDEEVWQRISTSFQPHNVFVNIPYTTDYRPLAAAIVATLTKVGLVPQLALLRSEGRHRLCKICEFMQISKYCITDLSRQDLHNMPFELGFCAALGRQVHTFVLIDQKDIRKDGNNVRKFDAQLSNLKGVVEVIVHNNNPDMLVTELLKRMQGAVPEVRIDGRRVELLQKIKMHAGGFEEAFKNGTIDEVVKVWVSTGAYLFDSLPSESEVRT